MIDHAFFLPFVPCYGCGVKMGMFFAIFYSGHVYICCMVALLQALLFRELVKVRYNTYFHIIDQNIPLFRTTQWIWFFMAIFYTYSGFAVEIVKSNTSLHYLLPYAELQGSITFFLYSGVFVLTISTMQIGYIRFQLNQLCWTIVVICLTVGQLKYIMHNGKPPLMSAKTKSRF
jgi:phosphatidate cytidylyltransferase